MRILRSPYLLSACLLASAFASAQDPPPVPTPTPVPAETKPAETAPAAPEAEAPARRPRRQPIVIEAGTIHPVAGPSIENGVVLIRGERIVAVGKKGEVEIPENAIVHAFPTGHVYPGLIDAQTDAFTDNTVRGDASLDGGSLLADGLGVRGDRDDELVQAGITTAYVAVRSPGTMRGQGAIVRPLKNGFELWKGREQAGVALRMTNGPVPSHALARQQQLDGFVATFDGLEEYRKARTDHDEALKKYEKEFAEYLAFHQKKKDGGKEPAKEGAAPATTPAATPPAGETPARPTRGPGGRRGGGGGGGGNEPAKDDGAALEAALAALFDALAQDPPKQDPPKPATPPANTPPQQGPPAPAANAPKPDEGPKRPTYPKAPVRDPQKDALLRVIDGELALRIEAHRPDELRGALALQQKNSIPLLVLEQAYGAATIAEDIARQGASVVLTEVLPDSMPELYKAFDPTALPSRLQAAGVSFAIATGSARRASLLPMMAAAAVGKGLDREAALRAVTLTPAEILGIGKDTGSLQQGKLADLMVCDRPLFASDSRVLFVLAKGRTEYEAQ